MNRISHQLVPNGGWQFLENGTLFKAQTWNDLVRDVRNHRISNQIPIGNLEEEIEDQIAEEHPSFIINGDKLKKKPMGVSYFSTIQSFAQFLWNYTLKGGGLVDQNTANIRADICAGCHNNKPSSEVRGGCSVCNKLGNAALDKVRSSIIKNNHTTKDARLLTCAICGCDSRISVWMPNSALLNTGDANAFPSFCWKKKVLEGKDL